MFFGRIVIPRPLSTAWMMACVLLLCQRVSTCIWFFLKYSSKYCLTMYANSEDFQVLAITTMVSSFVEDGMAEARSGIMNEV